MLSDFGILLAQAGGPSRLVGDGFDPAPGGTNWTLVVLASVAIMGAAVAIHWSVRRRAKADQGDAGERTLARMLGVDSKGLLLARELAAIGGMEAASAVLVSANAFQQSAKVLLTRDADRRVEVKALANQLGVMLG